MTLWTHSSQEFFSKLLVPSSYLVLDSWKGPTHISIVSGTCSHLNPLRLLAWQHRPGLGLLRLLHISQMWQKKILMNPIFLLDFYLMMSLFVIKPIDCLSWLVQEQRKQADLFTGKKKQLFWEKVGLCQVWQSWWTLVSVSVADEKPDHLNF